MASGSPLGDKTQGISGVNLPAQPRQVPDPQGQIGLRVAVKKAGEVLQEGGQYSASLASQPTGAVILKKLRVQEAR